VPVDADQAIEPIFEEIKTSILELLHNQLPKSKMPK